MSRVLSLKPGIRLAHRAWRWECRGRGPGEEGRAVPGDRACPRLCAPAAPAPLGRRLICMGSRSSQWPRGRACREPGWAGRTAAAGGALGDRLRVAVVAAVAGVVAEATGPGPG